MTVMSDEEVQDFLERNKWSTGIAVAGRSLEYNEPEANALLLKFPETPLRAAYFSRVISILGSRDEGMFSGALLWITLSNIWSPQIEKTGWTMLEMMRRGFGENRPLEAAAGHWFRNGAAVELAAFVLPCFVFGWDAYIVPSGADFFIHISHDEFWAVVTKNEAAYRAVLAELQDCDPQQDHQGLLREFCPNSKYLSDTNDSSRKPRQRLR